MAKMFYKELNEYGYAIALWDREPTEDVPFNGPYAPDEVYCPVCGGIDCLDANNTCNGGHSKEEYEKYSQ